MKKNMSVLDQFEKILFIPARPDIRLPNVEGYIPMSGKLVPFTSSVRRALDRGLGHIGEKGQSQPSKDSDKELLGKTAEKTKSFIKTE